MKKLPLFIALIAGYVLLLWIAAALPAEPVRRHIAASLPFLQAEAPDPFYGGYEPLFAARGKVNKATRLDATNHTMLNVAWNIDPAHPFTSPLEMRMSVPADSLPAEYGLSGLQAAVAGSDSTTTYERYWHGYLVVVRPLLEVFDYRDIRRVNVFCLGLLGAALVIVLSRRKGVFAAGALAVALLYVNFWMVPLALQYVAVFYLALGAALLVLLRPRTDMGTLLMVVGSLTAFLDFLTAPLLTLGLPLAMWLLTHEERLREAKLRDSVKWILHLCLIWAAGYAGTWAVKGLIAGMVADGGFWVFIKQIGYRLAGGSELQLGFWELRGRAIGYNLATLVAQYLGQTLVLVAALVAGWIKWRRRGKVSRMVWLWLLVAAMPPGWYAAVANHSLLHNYMTYRVLLLSVFGILMAWRETIEIKRI